MGMDFHEELAAAIEAANLASQVIKEAYQTLEADPTAQAHVTTKTDLASQEAILGYLLERFPGDSFAAEEDTQALKHAPRGGSRLWVVDPIDGTRGFVKKTGEFSVMIGFCLEGRAVVGVVAEPALDRLTFATLGGGTWVREKGRSDHPSRVSACQALEEAVLTRSHTKNPGDPGETGRKLGLNRFLERYSAGVKLALVARGEADIFVNDYPSYRDWDLCAGVILVEEAGGLVTDLEGNPVRFGRPGNLQDKGLVASTGGIHSLALIRLP